VEKVRRRSSAMKSDQSSDESSSHITGLSASLGGGHGIGRKELRSNSYKVDDPIEEVD
jgi:hypothetical protein